MTISTTSSRNDYEANGSTTAFAYTFHISASTALEVYVSGVLKALTTDYSVSGVGSSSGGTVTFTTAPAALAPVAIVRAEPYTQSTDWVDNDRMSASSIENAVDKVTKLVQQIREYATRGLRFAAGSVNAAEGACIPDLVASKYLRVNSTCDGFDLVGLEDCGSYANPVTTKGDLIRGGDTGVQERLAYASADGYTVYAHPLKSKPDWAPAGSVLLTNKSDTQADASRLHVLDMSCASAYVASNVQSCGRVTVINTYDVGDDCIGLVLFTGGPQRVRSQGNISIGDWVRPASTLGAVETTCVPMSHHRPIPKSSIGVAVTAASGDLVDILKFGAPSQGMQGFATIRDAQSQTCTSTNALTCTGVMLIARSLMLTDGNNDVVVVHRPNPVTVDITTDLTNKKNGRDQVAAFTDGDIHLYWVYEGASGNTYGRASTTGPPTGPTLPACETHWCYSESLRWNGQRLLPHTQRGNYVAFDCASTLICVNEGAATCETRINLSSCVPLIASRIKLGVRYTTTSATAGFQLYLGSRLNCISHVLVTSTTTTPDSTAAEVELPNIDQQFYYRTNNAAALATITVSGYTVPNGDA